MEISFIHENCHYLDTEIVGHDIHDHESGECQNKQINPEPDIACSDISANISEIYRMQMVTMYS